ncbi:MAG: class I mannose-6-phosphate isomerase [Prevotellaceae bacterium]|jgi:mannose-6-phosphate isomerase class I|nr:class I mannose-6-phosphate isomerase [Prevotellaceae bacterium]
MIEKTRSNYDKNPFVRVSHKTEDCITGWDGIIAEIHRKLQNCESKYIKIVVDCYSGVDEEEVIKAFSKGFPKGTIRHTYDVMYSKSYIDSLLFKNITYDPLFGYITDENISRFFSFAKTFPQYAHDYMPPCEIFIGAGASYLCPKADVLIYVDMARWEIQKRLRTRRTANLGSKRYMTDSAKKYKVAYFIDWPILDRHKKTVLYKSDYIIDANIRNNPKMITRDLFEKGLEKTVSQPFRLVPFFDPGPWGGQWMKKNFDLDKEPVNYAWCFDCVPEANSLVFAFGDTHFEIPALDLVFRHPEKLLGQHVFKRFGDEFPIRFDILDTMDGGNLSVQVHPTTEYIQEQFGMKYTQDESYYLLDTGSEAAVYLGLNENVDPETMISAFTEATRSRKLDVDKFVSKYSVTKHDHLLIPAGTVHGSGRNCVVLEISATPYIFTFKLWDWNRLDLDGSMRPLNIERGKDVIQWDRRESWVSRELINRFETISKDEDIHEERTGLHELEFIETHRHKFRKTVLHHTGGSVNVLNLVSGREAIVESPSGAFEPLIVHYAETFIIPECVGEYTITPYGESEGKYCMTIKAFVRSNE